MAIQPTAANHEGGQPRPDTAELPAVRVRRRRRPVVAAAFALVALAGLAAAGIGIRAELLPRTFTPAQRQRIEAWEVAKRWRTTPKTQIFPADVRYRLSGRQMGSTGGLNLTARRLWIARQSSCASAAGGSRAVQALLNVDGCQAILRATYTDASSSLVLTVGIAVLRTQANAQAVAHYLTSGRAGQPGVADQLVLRPVRVSGTPAAAFGLRQRQISWVDGSGPYLIISTVGFADGRPRVQVRTDAYMSLEMTSLARGVADVIAAPLGAAAPVPNCPGAPGC